MITKAATDFCRREFSDDQVHVILLPDSADVSVIDPGQRIFMLRHNYGFVGVTARLHADGSLTDLECRKI